MRDADPKSPPEPDQPEPTPADDAGVEAPPDADQDDGATDNDNTEAAGTR